MHFLQYAAAVLSVCITSTVADFLGPTYPAPLDLTSNESVVLRGWRGIISDFDAYLKGNQTAVSETFRGVENITFSGLAEFARKNPGEANPIFTTQWYNITPWALASQLSGVAALGIPLADRLLSDPAIGIIPVTAYGFPPLNTSVLGPCINDVGCSGKPNDFIQSVQTQPPSFLPWTSPAYSDNGFMLLGLAISNVTGKSMDTIYREAIFDPLGMASSSSSPPTDKAKLSRSVGASAEFLLDAGYTAPSGGLYATVNDLTKFGIGILNSTLLSVEQTRKWMKPITHTASLTYSTGAPWEIVRFIHPTTGKVTDIYTKLGDSGSYGGLMCIIPDYKAGFTMLNAYSNETTRSTAANIVIDHVIQKLLPALEAQATAEAIRNYAGCYASTDSSLNSSVTIAFNQSSVPGASLGLSITSWISNGTDVLANYLGGKKPRLFPSVPKQAGGPGKVAFQAATSFQTNSYVAASDLGFGPFTGSYGTNLDWLGVDASHYGGIGIRLFVFDVDGNGNATALSPAATRATLKRNA